MQQLAGVPGLRPARRRLKWNVERLSEASGINAKNIWNYEQGKAEPKASTLRALATALATSSDELLGLVEVPS